MSLSPPGSRQPSHCASTGPPDLPEAPRARVSACVCVVCARVCHVHMCVHVCTCVCHMHVCACVSYMPVCSVCMYVRVYVPVCGVCLCTGLSLSKCDRPHSHKVTSIYPCSCHLTPQGQQDVSAPSPLCFGGAV